MAATQSARRADHDGVTSALGQRQIGIQGGKAGPGRGKKTDDNVSRFKHGISRAYILARLDRDGHSV
jgi:hypothetical protein